MSVILKALRSQEENKQKKQPPSPVEGLIWGDMGRAHYQHPPSIKTIVILVSVLLAVAVFSGGLWFYKQSLTQRQVAAPSVKPAQIPASNPLKFVPSEIPKYMVGMVAKAKSHFHEGRFGESLELFQKALEKHPKSTLLHNDVGLNFLKMKLYEESKKHFEMAIRLDDECAECFNNLGYLTTLSGDAVEAEKHLKRAADLSRHYPDPYFNLGVLYEKNGDIGNAAAAYEEFLRRLKDKSAPIFAQVQDHLHALKVR